MRLIVFALLGMLACLFAGCSTASEQIRTKMLSERTDIFQETEGIGPPPKGMADLVIKTQIKTTVEGFYILESKDSPHGKPKYSFVFNIDGQVVEWKVDGKKEETSFYDKDGKMTADGGEGMKYVLEKRIRLDAGPHEILFALPGDNYFKKFAVDLKKGDVNILEFKPIYMKDNWRRETFLKGIKDFELFLNGKRLCVFP